MRKQSSFVPSKGSTALGLGLGLGLALSPLQDCSAASTQGGGGGAPSTTSATTSKNCIMFWKGVLSINPTVVNLEVPPTAISLGWLAGGEVELCLIGLNDGRVLISGRQNKICTSILLSTLYFNRSIDIHFYLSPNFLKKILILLILIFFYF